VLLGLEKPLLVDALASNVEKNIQFTKFIAGRGATQRRFKRAILRIISHDLLRSFVNFQLIAKKTTPRLVADLSVAYRLDVGLRQRSHA
jgi:hypothetical protein